MADITYAIPSSKENNQKNNNNNDPETPNNQEQDSLEVNRNGHFVKAIQWRTHNRIRPLMGSSMLKSKVPRMLETVLSPIGNCIWFCFYSTIEFFLIGLCFMDFFDVSLQRS